MSKFLNIHYKKKGYKGKYLKIRVKEHKRNMRIGIISLASLSLLIYFVSFIPYSTNYKIELYYDQVAKIFEHDKIAISISEVCINFKDEDKQIECVNNFVKEFFYYDNHNTSILEFRTPKEIINSGGCCRDYTLFYKAIFTNMGYESEFILTPKDEPRHIYLRVFGKSHNWLIDQGWITTE